MPSRVVVVGGGPAGLTAAYLLAKKNVPVTVLEADPRLVGGIARTLEYKGYRFDIGGHRFYSKSAQVENLWTEILGDDLLTRTRSSRIYYRNRFFHYPLRPMEAFRGLGWRETLACLGSYLWAKLRRASDPRTFEEWVSARFGRRLFGIFFKTYTEKVWGMRCDEISADWAAQRINELSILRALTEPIWRWTKRRAPVKTLLTSFRYPRLGPGMMWEECARKAQARGARLEMGARVSAFTLQSDGASWEVGYHDAGSGEERQLTADQVLVSCPLSEAVSALSPAVSPEVARAASSLRYRDFVLVALILRDRGRMKDTWLYVHDPTVKVCRIQNYKAWSPEMVPDARMTCFGMEYFVTAGDDDWGRADAEWLSMASRELIEIGLIEEGDVQDGCVVKQRKAYPVYDEGYHRNIDVIREELKRYPGIHFLGRNGMHRYNNQDHAMMTAMLSVENILAGKTLYDPWLVNQDAEYLETHGS